MTIYRTRWGIDARSLILIGSLFVRAFRACAETFLSESSAGRGLSGPLPFLTSSLSVARYWRTSEEIKEI